MEDHENNRLTTMIEPDVRDLLTLREAEILHWCGMGKIVADIASMLEISENTVKFHLKNIYQKLQVPNRAAAIRVAAQKGLIFSEVDGRKRKLVHVYQSFVDGDPTPLFGNRPLKTAGLLRRRFSGIVSRC